MSRQALKQIQSKIFTTKPHFEASIGDSLTNYYPPDISFHKLAQQDSSLKKLKLRNEDLDKKINREIMLQRRNKTIRVSALLGPIKAIEEGQKKKKKRK